MHTVLSDRPPNVNDRSPHVSDRSPHVRESGFRDPRNSCFWNPKSGKFLLVELKYWALDSEIQLKILGIPLTIGIRNPSSGDKESRIQNWNPESMAWSPESSFEFPYLGRDGRQPEVGLFPSDMSRRYRIGLFKCLFSYRDDLLEELGKLQSSKVQKDFTFDCPPSLKNALSNLPCHDLLF